MTFTDILQRTWRENILFSALVELTYRCNLNCFFCYNDTDLKGVPLSTAQYVRFFEDLRELGTLNLTLSGGEPLTHPEFFTLGRKARELGFLVRVKSNGHALRGSLARRVLEEVDPFIVEISLHGACPETHDRQTRVPGSFTQLMANVREALALGFRITLNTPLTAWNEQEVEAMFAMANQLRVPIRFDPHITRRDDGNHDPLQVAPSAEGLARLCELQRRRGASANPEDRGSIQASAATWATDSSVIASDKQCGAGSSTITVDPFGNVYPCVQWRRLVGNLHEQSILALWHDSGELADIRRLAGEVKRAIGDQTTPDVGFCPGFAEQEAGHATRLYPLSRLLMDPGMRTPAR